MKNVLITGAADGIGKACAKLFAQNNYRVAINYFTNKQGALELEKELTDNYFYAKAFKCDITDETQVGKMFSDIKELWGELDVLVNNSGVSEQKLFTDISEKDWDKIFDVNVKGTFLCSKYAVNQMLKNHCGSIVNISSMWGQVGASCEVHYSASKAAIIGMTKALAKEIGLSGIRVNCVCPGVIDTKMNAHLSHDDILSLAAETPLNRIGTPDEIAQAVFFFSGEKASFITGQSVGVNGGIVI